MNSQCNAWVHFCDRRSFDLLHLARLAKQGADRKLNLNSTRERIMIIYLLFPLQPSLYLRNTIFPLTLESRVVEPPKH